MSHGVVPAPSILIDGAAMLVSGASTADNLDPELQGLLQHHGSPSQARLQQGGGTLASCQQHDSLDYEEIENTVYRSDQAATNTEDSITYTSAKWMICFGIGVATALAAFTVNLSVENIAGFRFWVTLTMMEKGWYVGSFVVYAFINALLVAGSVLITIQLGPAAAGSGIAEVKAYLNGIDVPGIFHFQTLVAKVVGAVGSVAGGLAIGKEGPFVHAGACVAALLSQGGSSSYQLPYLKRFWNDRDRHDMVACGAAAGVAAAFRSPVGGVLFVLEEMTSWWKNSLLWLSFFTTAVVSVAIRILMKACTKHGCGFFGSGGFIIFEISEGQDNYEFYELLPVLLLGVMGGLLGSGFIVLNGMLTAWRHKIMPQYGKKGRLVEGLLISLLTSTVAFLVPLAVRCQSSHVVSMHNPGDFASARNALVAILSLFGLLPSAGYPDEYNDLATLFFNTQDDAIRSLFSAKTKREYTVSTLVTFASVFYALAVLTYGISCPTGLFVPGILCGATYGRLVGIFVADTNPRHNIDEGTYALLGAASFLGGSMRLTVCTCVLLLELTNNLALLPLVMLVLLVAKAVGDGTGVKALYEYQMAVKHLPFLPPTAEGAMRHISAKECCGRPPVTFHRVEKVRHLVSTLKSCSHNGFPVMSGSADGERFILGVILRQQLMVLLSSQSALQASATVSDVSSRVATTFSTADFSKPISTPAASVHDLCLPADALDMYIDLGPYANPSYYVVQEDTSLSKVYSLFRTLGLRHLCVIPRASNVVGIVTRQDLLPEVVEERFTGPGHYTTDGLTLSSHPPTPPPLPTPPPEHSTAGQLVGGFLNRRQARSAKDPSSSTVAATAGAVKGQRGVVHAELVASGNL